MQANTVANGDPAEYFHFVGTKHYKPHDALCVNFNCFHAVIKDYYLKLQGLSET